MGNAISYIRHTKDRRLKRGFQELGDDEEDLYSELDRQLHTPKRKKLMSTSKYIYKTLFLEGQNSDITIIALDVEWRLHRVYICQSPYFSSMFSGSWKEAHAEEINIEIADPNITVDALKIVLGSLYQDEITLEPAHVVPVLGAAMLFQLDSLIQQCCDIMKESINVQSVITYYHTSAQYGLEEIHKECFGWLLRNVLSYLPEHPKTLRDVSINLMIKLINSPDLYVVQTEFSIYVVLKMWVFLKENPLWDGKASECMLESHKYFQKISSQGCFLLSDRGRVYKETFLAVRFSNLIHHHIDVEMLDMDLIVPPEWLLPVFKAQWYSMLRIDQGVDRGPKQLTGEEFNRHCLRCGRILPVDAQHMWRWTGYNFGLDLIVTYDKRIFRLKRNDRSYHDYQNTMTQQSRRHLAYRFTVSSLNEQKQLNYTATSGLQFATLSKNEEIQVMILDKEVTFPLILSANFVLISPPSSERTSTLNSSRAAEIV